MIQDHEITAWLGPAADETTDEQRDAIRYAWGALDEILPSDEDDPDRAPATSGAAAYILGDLTLADAGRAVMAARLAHTEAMATLQGAMVAAAQAGIPETRIAEESGMNRKTVRARLGKGV